MVQSKALFSNYQKQEKSEKGKKIRDDGVIRCQGEIW